MDLEANNYDEDATDDDGTCIFGYNFTHNLSLGNNLLSLPGDLENNSSIHQMDLIQSTGESIAFIIGQGVGLFNTNEGWTGNLMNLSPYSGYWLNISSSNNYQWDLEFNNSVENCEIYPNISVGNNLISFKWGNGSAPTLESLGGEEFASENFNFIIGQGVGLFNTNDGWSGNLNSLEEGKGYWVNVQENLNEFKWGFDNCNENPSNLGMINTEISNNLLSDFSVQQSTNQAFYIIDEILIDGENPNEGDERGNRIFEALGKIGDTKAMNFLIECLQNKEETVRLAATRGLGKTRNESAIEPLIKALEDEEKNVRKSAVNALDELGWDPNE